MKSKRLILICSLSSLFISINGYSKESKICTDPVKTICRDTMVQRTSTSEAAERLRTQIYSEARKNAKSINDKLEKKYTDSWHKKDREIFRYIILNQEIIKAANSKISGMEKAITNMMSSSLTKTYMKLAIDETNFNESTKKAFKKTIDSVVIGSFNDYNIRLGAKYDVSGLIKYPCGIDAMDGNAFSTIINNQQYVLVCPRFLINFGQNRNEQERLNSALLAITHEMGHHIANSNAAETKFLPYVSCMANNYGDKFNPSYEDAVFCNKVARNKQDCRDKVTVSHASELIADQWGLQVLATYAKKNHYSIAQTEKFLRNNYIKICDLPDVGIHPSTDFRLESMMRLDPTISDQLSCNNSRIKKPSCTFDGEVRI